MTPPGRLQCYWRRTLWLTGALLVVWAAVTFLPIWFAPSLNRLNFFGWPLGYYMDGQGALLVYVAIVWGYAGLMDRLDRRCVEAGNGQRTAGGGKQP